jgi:hypothetical protein
MKDAKTGRHWMYWLIGFVVGALAYVLLAWVLEA